MLRLFYGEALPFLSSYFQTEYKRRSMIAALMITGMGLTYQLHNSLPEVWLDTGT